MNRASSRIVVGCDVSTTVTPVRVYLDLDFVWVLCAGCVRCECGMCVWDASEGCECEVGWDAGVSAYIVSVVSDTDTDTEYECHSHLHAMSTAVSMGETGHAMISD